mmetsp:Transcript_58476/g.190708  ORF Transcript_58476/g.190708 Transcript_58476/m.190708 type:complete len:321 (-) Transcript_58476:1426-2388(-)
MHHRLELCLVVAPHKLPSGGEVVEQEAIQQVRHAVDEPDARQAVRVLPLEQNELADRGRNMHDARGEERRLHRSWSRVGLVAPGQHDFVGRASGSRPHLCEYPRKPLGPGHENGQVHRVDLVRRHYVRVLRHHQGAPVLDHGGALHEDVFLSAHQIAQVLAAGVRVPGHVDVSLLRIEGADDGEVEWEVGRHSFNKVPQDLYEGRLGDGPTPRHNHAVRVAPRALEELRERVREEIFDHVSEVVKAEGPNSRKPDTYVQHGHLRQEKRRRREHVLVGVFRHLREVHHAPLADANLGSRKVRHREEAHHGQRADRAEQRAE